jgi:dihydroneopterin aldolase
VSGDRIEVRGLRVLATHGVLDHERAQPQPFELDLDVVVDLAGPGSSDELADTLDYSVIVGAAAETVRSGSFRLLEALAEAVAATLLRLDGTVAEVSVAVRKLRPPLPEDLGSVGVRVVRRRDGPSGR